MTVTVTKPVAYVVGLMSVAVLGLASWGLLTIHTMSVRQEVTNTKLDSLEKRIDGQMDDRYRASQARADMAALDDKSKSRDAIQAKEVESIKARIRDLEDSVEKHHDRGGHQVMERRVDALERWRETHK